MINRLARRFTVGNLVVLLLVVMIGTSAVNVGAVYYQQSEFETADNSVDVAGEQRMLTQRMARYTNQIATGDADEETYERLDAAAQRYESNLQTIRNGGEVDGNELDAAPASTHEELDRQRAEWDEFREHVHTIVETDPQDPEYRAAVEYVEEHDDELLDSSEAVVQTYVEHEEADRYSEEIDVAGRQRMLSQRIAKTVFFINQNERPGEDDPEVARAKADLQEYLAEYDAALTALEEGGTHRGVDLQAAPPEVQSELTAAREVWGPFEEEASTVATTEKHDPEFVESLQYVRANSDSLMETSDDTVSAFSQFIDERNRLLQQFLLGLFAVNFAVFVVGGVLTRRYVGKALSEVSDAVETLGEGSIDTDIGEGTRAMSDVYDDATKNEVIGLAAATENLEANLATVVGQAKALARQDFEADVLDEEVPGEFGTALGEMRRDLETLITEIEAARTEAETMAETLERQAIEFGDVLEAAADGDLSVRMDTDIENESMREIARSFNDMLSEFEATMVSLQGFADDVAAATEEVTASVEEVSTASAEVSSSIQQIADGANDQSQQLQEVTRETEQLSATVEEVASQAATVAETAEETADLGTSGRRAAEEAIDEMREIEALADETVEAVRTLADRFEEIGDTVEVISDIADETNLLALNANIEAANAQASSDGFAVVADEVKALAEESKASAGEIEGIIGSAREQMTATVEDVEQTQRRVDDGVEAVEETVDILEEMVDNVEETNEGVQDISDATDDQAGSTQEVAAIVDDVASISEETTAEAESVSAASEEQASSLEEVQRSMRSLSEQASDLHHRLGSFTVERASAGDEATASGSEPESGETRA